MKNIATNLLIILTHNKRFKCSLIGCVTILSAILGGAYQTASAQTWYLKPSVGLSIYSSVEGTSENIGTADGKITADLDTGFSAGLGIGYQINKHWSIELDWEYRSNDSSTTLPDGDTFDEGNYASNVFFINGYYDFAPVGSWTSFTGAGLAFIQEIDVDLERDGAERSYSASADLGFQVVGGVKLKLDKRLDLYGAARYQSFPSIDTFELEEGTGTGTIDGFDYSPASLTIGAYYRF